MDHDGSLGIRQWFESPYREGEIISIDEYWQWIFEHSVPGLPEAAAQENLSPLAYMKKYGAFEITNNKYEPYTAKVDATSVHEVDGHGAARDVNGKVVGVQVGEDILKGFGTPSGKLEFFSPTLHQWGWPEQRVHHSVVVEESRASVEHRPHPGRNVALAELSFAHPDSHPLRQQQMAVRNFPQKPHLDAPRRCGTHWRAHGGAGSRHHGDWVFRR